MRKRYKVVSGVRVWPAKRELVTLGGVRLQPKQTVYQPSRSWDAGFSSHSRKYTPFANEADAVAFVLEQEPNAEIRDYEWSVSTIAVY